MAKTSTTIIGHVDRAVDFFNKPNLFMAIAAQDPWPLNGVEETTDFSISVKSVPLLDVTDRNIGRIIELANSHTIVDVEEASIPGLEEGTRTDLEKAMRAKLTSKPFFVLKDGNYSYRDTFTVLVDSEGLTFIVTRASDGLQIGTGAYPIGTYKDTIIPGVVLSVEANPDLPDLLKNASYTFSVDAAFGFVKIEEIRFVRKLKEGEAEGTNTITYRNEKWKFFTTPEEAYEEVTRAVYVKATFDYDNFPLIDFRKVGIFSHLQRAEGVSETLNKLLPHQIADCGVLHLIDCRSAIYRTADQREVFAFIIEH